MLSSRFLRVAVSNVNFVSLYPYEQRLASLSHVKCITAKDDTCHFGLEMEIAVRRYEHNMT